MVSSAILIVFTYTFLFLGSFSTIHCRAISAATGIFCILLSYASGFGFMYLIGMKTLGLHNLMPFLLVGIGVNDMFVMCNAIDQVDLKKPHS